MRQVVTSRDEFTGHELAFGEELSLAEHRHRAPDQTCRRLIDSVLQVHHFLLLLPILTLFSFGKARGSIFL